jgi:hypothetical protein
MKVNSLTSVDLTDMRRFFFLRKGSMANNSCEKSAEVVVGTETSLSRNKRQNRRSHEVPKDRTLRSEKIESYCMKGRKQKISKDTCPPTDRAALDNKEGGQTFLWITENEVTNKPHFSDYYQKVRF